MKKFFPYRVREVLGVTIASFACILFFYRAFFFSHFDHITGDPGDARLYITLLEHWRAVLAGQASFANPNFFAPTSDVLAYSDALILYVPEFLFFRGLGLDRYLAFQWTLIVIRLIGFVACYLLLRKKLGLDLFPSLAGASLFSVAHIYYYSAGHPQLASMAFAVVLILMLVHYFQKPDERAWVLWSGAALYGLLFFTGYYIAFFCALAAVAMLISWIVLRLARDGGNPAALWKSEIRRFVRDMSIALGIFLVFLIPFLAVYLPGLHTTGGRTFADVESSLQSSREIFNVSPTNFVWGSVMGKIYAAPIFHHGEICRGFGPVSVLLAATAFYWMLRRWRSRKFPLALLATAISCGLLYNAAAFFFRWSPWWLVYHLVPGAQAIRVPNRINHMVAFGIAILCAVALQQMLDRSRRLSSGGRIVSMAGIVLLVSLVILEQGDHSSQNNISRAWENALFSRVPPPPPACTHFFLVDPRIPAPDLIGHIDAMLIAREKDIPTLDGYSGWTPPGWTLGDLSHNPAPRAEQYAEKHGIGGGLCEFDERQNQWSLAPAIPPAR